MPDIHWRMTTTVSIATEGAPTVGAFFHVIESEPKYKGLKRLVPKLKRPSWVREMHRRKRTEKQEAKPLPVSDEQQAHRERKRAAKKPKAKRSRIERALSGEHTRVTKAA